MMSVAAHFGIPWSKLLRPYVLDSSVFGYFVFWLGELVTCSEIQQSLLLE
jgi:hypothetical protein